MTPEGYRITDAAWERVADYLVDEVLIDGDPGVARRALNGLIWKVLTRCPWRELPHLPWFASRRATERYAAKWHEAGVLGDVLRLVAAPTARPATEVEANA